MADGILGRWSQRKQAAREGKPLEEPVRVVPAPATALVPAPTSDTVSTPTASPIANAVGAAITEPASEPPNTQSLAPPPPTMEDVQALTPGSDFSAFTGAKVSPEVSNAAMKKLFADPHYNVMDGLDIYIDDYSKPDPLPASMLRQMTAARLLNLFDDEKDENASAAVPHNPPAPSSPETPAASAPLISEDHDDPDLRLQPNHAAGSPDPGRGAE